MERKWFKGDMKGRSRFLECEGSRKNEKGAWWGEGEDGGLEMTVE